MHKFCGWTHVPSIFLIPSLLPLPFRQYNILGRPPNREEVVIVDGSSRNCLAQLEQVSGKLDFPYMNKTQQYGEKKNLTFFPFFLRKVQWY